MYISNKKSILVLKPNLNQMKDSGMAFVLICIILGLLSGSKYWFFIGLVLQLLNMVYPGIFFLPAIFWFTLSNILGFISSKILLTLIFFLIITPIGLIRKFLGFLGLGNKSGGFDSLKLKQWKKSHESVFVVRKYKFSKKDLMKPY
ncbi:MAG: hypothetical protein HZB41_08580 [Ignavibacteriae bacterium]|nr:hypothetical protein [Ignavibacteriota bacterium]